MEATNSWGHVNVFAKGAGHAVAQLDVDYGVDYEPFKVDSSRTKYFSSYHLKQILMLLNVCLTFIYLFHNVYRIILQEISTI